MTILFILETLFAFGGTPRKLLILTRGMKKRGWHPIIACTGQKGGLEDSFRHSGVEVIYLKKRRKISLFSIFEILSIIKKYRVDLVSAFFARASIYGQIASILARVPIIVNEVGIPRNERIIIRILENFLTPFTDKVICNSHATMRKVKAKILLLRKKRTAVIYNGIEVKEYQKEGNKAANHIRNELSIPLSSFVLSYIGGFVIWRDHKTLIKSFRKIKCRFPETHLVLVGDGPILNEIKKLCNDFNIERDVHFLGYRNDVKKVLEDTDIYINPSYAEGFGINIIEAMAMNIPIIAAEAGAIPEIIECDVNGLLFKPRDSEDLYKRILDLLQNSIKRRELAKAGRKTVEKKFTAEIFIEKTIEAYQKVIQNA